jgi:hypothetical protein
LWGGACACRLPRGFRSSAHGTTRESEGLVSRPEGTPGWLWNFWPGSTELDHHNLTKPLGPVDPGPALSRHLNFSADPGPLQPQTRRGMPPASQRLCIQLARAVQLAAQDPQPTPRPATARTRQGTRAARTLPRPSDSDWTRSQLRHRAAHQEPTRGGCRPCTSRAPPGCTSRARADLTTLAKCDTGIPRESCIRLNPPPEILSRPPTCYSQARRGTRCTDSPAGRRPGLGRALVTLH